MSNELKNLSSALMFILTAGSAAIGWQALEMQDMHERLSRAERRLSKCEDLLNYLNSHEPSVNEYWKYWASHYQKTNEN